MRKIVHLFSREVKDMIITFHEKFLKTLNERYFPKKIMLIFREQFATKLSRYIT